MYEFHHIQTDLFRGYRRVDLGAGQSAFVATPEKSLLDLIYLQPGSDSSTYLSELRLQNLDRLNLDELHHQAELADRPKFRHVADWVANLAQAEAQEYEVL